MWFHATHAKLNHQPAPRTRTIALLEAFPIVEADVAIAYIVGLKCATHTKAHTAQGALVDIIRTVGTQCFLLAQLVDQQRVALVTVGLQLGHVSQCLLQFRHDHSSFPRAQHLFGERHFLLVLSSLHRQQRLQRLLHLDKAPRLLFRRAEAAREVDAPHIRRCRIDVIALHQRHVRAEFQLGLRLHVDLLVGARPRRYLDTHGDVADLDVHLPALPQLRKGDRVLDVRRKFVAALTRLPALRLCARAAQTPAPTAASCWE